MRRRLYFWLILFIGLMFFAPKVYAAECVTFQNGSGTEEDPYQITTNAELYSITCHLSSHYVLMNDLDLTYDTQNENGNFYNDGNGWISIQYYETYFTGSLDGNNHKIIGMYQNLTNDGPTSPLGGLFSRVNGNISDLTLENFKIECNNKNESVNGGYTGYYIGTLAAYTHDSIIENVSTSGVIEITNKNQNPDNLYVGGVIGVVYDSTLRNITSNVEIKNNSVLVNIVGGISGEFYNSTLENALNNGNLEGGIVGGIAAYATGGVKFINVRNNGNINARTVGGLAFQASGTIINSSNYGEINMQGNGNSIVGGLVGTFSPANDNEESTYIKNSYNVGNIKAVVKQSDSGIGGLVGSAFGNEYIENSFNAGEINVISKALPTNYSYCLVGGLVGSDAMSTKNSYNVGNIKLTNVNNSGHSGELAGVISGILSSKGTFENTYYVEKGIKAFSNDANSQSLNYKALTFDQAILENSYSGFDFENVWTFEENYPFPQLKGNLLDRSYITNIQINNTENELSSEDNNKIEYTITPISLSDEEVEFSIVEGKDKATIDSSGNIEIIGNGTIVVKVASKKLNSIYATKEFNTKLIKDIETLGFSQIEPLTYDGDAKTPEIEIFDGDYKLGVSDFDVEYTNNVNAGSNCMARIIGKGNYKGEKILSFEISKANFNDLSKNTEVFYDDNPHTIDVNISQNDYNITYSIDGGANYNLNTIPTYKDVGEYTINYKITKDNYNDYSSNKKVSIYGITGFGKNIKMNNNILTITDYNNTFSSIKTRITFFSKSSAWRHLDSSKKEVNGNTIKTGEYVQLILNGSKTYEYQLSILGDVNGDGKISALDYVKIKNHIMKTSMITSEVNLIAADLNEDQKISALDYVRIKNYIMNGGN